MGQLTITDVFNDAQKGAQNHAKLVKNLTKIFKKMDFAEFCEQYLHHLKYSLVVFKREAAVEWTLEFVAKFAVSLNEKEEKDKAESKKEKSEDEETDEDEEEEEEAEELNPLLLNLFNFLLEHHDACDHAVRYRCCQMVNKLLNHMGEDAQIDDDLYDKVYGRMLQRLRDKFPVVRVQAVRALARLQDPTDKDCAIIEAYLFLLNCDPNHDVRRAVLTNIAASTKTLPSILERTRDVKDAVRKLAYQVLSDKVHIKALTIAQRVRLLQEGMTDRTELVQDACCSRLLQSWLRIFEGNILQLLGCLDVESSMDTAVLTLKMLFKKVQASELVQQFDLLDENLVIPVEELTCESSLYWRCLCQHLASLAPEADEQLEKIMPSGTNLSTYIARVFDLMKAEEDIDAQLRNEFILMQLLMLAGVLDLSDEVGRRHLSKLVHDMLVDEKVGHTLVKILLTRYNEIHRDHEHRVNHLIEIISEIREPITVVESTISKEDKRKNDLKLASVRVELNQLREELDTCIKDQNFSRAADIKERVMELDQTKQNLLDEAMPQTQEVRQEKNDPATLLKCLTICTEMLQEARLQRLIPSLQTLMEVLILPGIQNEDPAVRNSAVKSLGLICQMSKDTAKTHLLLFVQVSQIDQEVVAVTSMQVMFDLLHTFGLQAFEVDDVPATPSIKEAGDVPSPFSDSDGSDDELEMTSSGENIRPKEQEKAHTAASLLTILAGLLDNESSEIRTVTAEGLAKLLLARRVVSPKLLSHLLLLWYNPITEDDTHLRHCLGTFLPLYAFSSKSAQEVVEEAFMPTMRTLLNAPSTSPLAEVNISNVSELLVQLTNVRHLNNVLNITERDSSCHDNLAVKVCNEVLSDPNSFDVRTWCKILNILEMSPNNNSNNKDLFVLAERMLEEVKERLCVQALQKFQTNVSNLCRSYQNRTSRSTVDISRAGDEMLDRMAVIDTDVEKAEQADDEEGAEEDEVETEATQSEVASSQEAEDADVSQSQSTQPSSQVSNPMAGTSHIPEEEEDKEPVEEQQPRTRKASPGWQETGRAGGAKRKTRKESGESSSDTEVNEVFSSPTPIRRVTRGKRGRKKAAMEPTKRNLEELLDDASETDSPVKNTRTTRVTRSSRVPLGHIENEAQ